MDNDEPHADTSALNNHVRAPGFPIAGSTAQEPWQASASVADRADAIRQGKEKAKEVIESSLSTPTINNSRSRANSRSPPPISPSDQTSRKRSRSGQPVPVGPGKTANATQDDPSSSTSVHEGHLRQYIWRDQLASVAQIEQETDMRTIITKMHGEIKTWNDARRSYPIDPGWIYGPGFQGYGNGWTAPLQPPQGAPKLLYVRQRKRPGRRRTPELRWNRRARDLQKDMPEDLVPIRLDLEIDKLRLRDTFTWNVHDMIVPPRLFAEGLVEDFQIPLEHSNVFADQVTASIREQIQDYHPHLFFEDEPLDPHLPYTAYKDDDMRVTIKLQIVIGNHTLVDQFEWDINNPDNSPEEFAAGMAADLCLSGEFMTAIAHAIREQTQMFTKGLYITGHQFDGRPIEDPDLIGNFLPSPPPSVFRNYQHVRDFTPGFFELGAAELEKFEDSFQREQRSQKRSVNRRGGLALPDVKERPRTVRTMLVSDVVPGAAETLEESGIFRPTRTTGRRTRIYNDGSEGSDVGEESDGGGGSPGRAVTQGTARTRGLRVAASAAQAAMRANLNGSPTPDRVEPVVRKGRTGGYEVKEDSEGEIYAGILRLKMPRERYRRWWRGYKLSLQVAAEEQAKQRALLAQQQSAASAASPQQFQSPTASRQPSRTKGPEAARPFHVAQSPGTPANAATPQLGSNGPTGAPAAQSQTPRPAQSPTAPPPPPAPLWLVTALDQLRAKHPNKGSYQATMRLNPADGTWQPRIRCLTCANNILYKTEESEPVTNFLTHFNHQNHIDKVEEKRLAAGGKK